MQTIITESDLRVAILQLERKQTEEAKIMKAQFLVAVESIKPINLIKSAFIEATESEDLQDNVINSSIGLSVGYLSKVLFQAGSGSPIRKMIGTALMFGIKKIVAQNPDTVKTLGRVIFSLVRNLLSEKDKKAQTDKEWKTVKE